MITRPPSAFEGEGVDHTAVRGPDILHPQGLRTRLQRREAKLVGTYSEGAHYLIRDHQPVPSENA